MRFDELLETVKELNEKEKLQLVQLLIEELKLVGSAYEIFTPFGNEAAARILESEMELRQAARQPEGIG